MITTVIASIALFLALGAVGVIGFAVREAPAYIAGKEAAIRAEVQEAADAAVARGELMAATMRAEFEKSAEERMAQAKADMLQAIEGVLSGREGALREELQGVVDKAIGELKAALVLGGRS